MTDPFSIATGAAGIVSLGLTVCSGLLEYYGTWKDYEEDVLAFNNSLEDLQSIFQALESFFQTQNRNLEDSASPRVQECLGHCKGGLETLNRRLQKVKSSPISSSPQNRLQEFKRRAAYPFKKSTIMKHREIVSDLRGNLHLALTAFSM